MPLTLAALSLRSSIVNGGSGPLNYLVIIIAGGWLLGSFEHGSLNHLLIIREERKREKEREREKREKERKREEERERKREREKERERERKREKERERGGI